MIRGFIDFNSLDSERPFTEVSLDRGHTRPGFQLEIDARKVRSFARGHQAIALLGQPRIRDKNLAERIEQEGWHVAVPLLCSAPEEFLRQISGRFALFWVDLTRGQLGLASDRFNTNGFCYAQEGSRLSFADRANTVPSLHRELDQQAIFDYLYFHVIPAPVTIFKNVLRLEPGSRLLADGHRTDTSPWWQARFEEPSDADFQSSASTFRQLIKTAVERDLNGDPVGAFLSGGTDSSTVVGMLSRTASPVTAYSIGFEAEGYDEMEFARIAAKHFGVTHKPYYITSDDLVANIPAVAASYDQPFGNSSVLPAYLCAKLAHDDGLTRMFAGDGGDELFGGNSRYAKQRIFGYYEKVPGIIKGALLEPTLMQTPLGKLPLMRKAASYVEQARIPLPDRTAKYNLLDRLGIEKIFPTTFLNGIDQGAPLKLQQRVWREVHAHALVNKMLGFDWRFTLADNDLPKVIGATQLAGVDAIFPLLDDDLLDFSLQLPPEYKLKGIQLRWFFKEALRDFLPQEIIAKKKQGFGLPFGHWVLKHQGLLQLARGSLAVLTEKGILRKDFVDDLFKIHLPAFPGYYGEMVWISMMLGQWLLAYENTAPGNLSHP